MLFFSPIDTFEFNNNTFYIKRDDLLDKDFNGNKARKFYYYLVNDFDIDTLVSFGSNQSNAMYSMSVLAKRKGWKFKYYTSHISSYLKQNPMGNYKYALLNGMEIIETGLDNEKLRDYVLSLKEDHVLIIEEGGRDKNAKYGIKLLAEEINQFCKDNNLKVFLPSGTGTTAYFLAQFLDVEVMTISCVGDDKYLKKQFSWLGGGKIPTILPKRKKYHFGKLYKNLYEIYLSLQNQIEFDLLYDVIALDTIKYLNLKDILYIHQGGIIGNESMLKRYQYKYKNIV